MADDNAKLLIVLEAQSKKLQNQLVTASRQIDRFAAQTNRRFDVMNAKNAASFDRLNRRVGVSMSALQAGIGKAFAGAAALRGAQVLIDASTRIENSLKVVGLAGDELTRVYDALFESAQRNMAPLESLTTLFSRLGLAQKELGVSTDDLISFTDNVALALRVQGTNAQEARGALIQLSQAMGSGIVRAEEFNSVVEGAPSILRAAAAGLAEAGGSVAKLRALVVDGKVSSQAFFNAFQAGAVILEGQVANAEVTVSQGFVRLQNVLIDTAGKFDDATGASARIGSGLEELAEYIAIVGSAIADNKENINWFVDQLGRSAGNMPVFADILRGLDALKAFSRESEEAAQSVGEVESAAIDAIAAMVGFDGAAQFSPEQLATFQALIDQMAVGEAGADELRAALAEMGLTPVNFMIAFGGLTDLINKLRETRGEAIATAAAVAAAASGQSSGSNINDQRAEQLGLRGKPAVAVKPVSLADYPIVGDGSSGGSSKQSPGEKFEDRLRKQAEENRLLAEKTALQATLNPLINDYGFAVEKLQVAQDLQSAATEAGIELTPDLKAKIDELATGYANASVEAARLAEAQDGVKRLADDFGNAGKSALSGFISDLREGKSAADALGNAMNSILDSVIQIGINALFGGFGGGGFLGGIFGFAKGGIAAHGRPQPLPMFAKGGVSKTAAIFGEAGAEAAVPLPDGRRIPVDLRLQAPPPPTPTNRGLHITVGVAADSAGNLTPFVESVADSRVALAAPSIGGAAVRTSAKQAPLATSEYQARFGTKRFGA